MNEWKRQSGVTLIELIIVIAIIGIIMGIAITTIGNRRPVAQLKSDARDIVSNMQLARANAIRDTRPWAIQFDTDNQRYEVYSDSGEDWKSEDWSDGDETIFRTISLSNNIAFGTNQGPVDASWVTPADGISLSANRVVFNPNGTSESGAIYLTLSSGETIAISSLSTTGRIKVWENFGGSWNE